MKHEIKRGITNQLRLDLSQWGLGVTNATVNAEIKDSAGDTVYSWADVAIVDNVANLDTTPAQNEALTLGHHDFEARITYSDTGNVYMLIDNGLIIVTD